MSPEIAKKISKFYKVARFEKKLIIRACVDPTLGLGLHSSIHPQFFFNFKSDLTQQELAT